MLSPMHSYVSWMCRPLPHCIMSAICNVDDFYLRIHDCAHDRSEHGYRMGRGMALPRAAHACGTNARPRISYTSNFVDHFHTTWASSPDAAFKRRGDETSLVPKLALHARAEGLARARLACTNGAARSWNIKCGCGHGVATSCLTVM